MNEEAMKKREKLIDLIMAVGDDLINRYMDTDSDEMLDEKQEVLTALKAGTLIKDIPKYYDVLSTPANAHWD